MTAPHPLTSPPGAVHERETDLTGEGRTAAGWVRRAVEHPVDAIFALAVAGSLTARLWLTRSAWFYLDDWPLALQSRQVGHFFRPYNEHLTPVMLGIYRLQMELFGFRTYLPLQIAGALSMAGVAVAMFVAARRTVGPLVGALVALPMIWFNRMTLEPAVLDVYLALLGGIGCAYLLERPSTRGRDGWLAGFLTLSLCSAGPAVPVAVACLVHNACTQAPKRRWAAVVVPLAAWALWWMVTVRHAVPPNPSAELHGGAAVRAVGRNLVGSFDQLAWGNHVIGRALLLLVVVRAVQLLRTGLVASAHLLAWGSALVAWWTGLALTRGSTAVAALEFRYAYVAGAFILLAVLPRTPWRWPPLERGRSLAGATLVAAAALVYVVLAVPDLRASSRWLTSTGRATRATVALVDRGPAIVPDDVDGPLTTYLTPAGDMRALITRYGSPFPSKGDAAAAVADAWRIGAVRATSTTDGARCRSVPDDEALPEGTVLAVSATSRAVDVEARRAGTGWTSIASTPAGRRLELRVPQNWGRWMVRARDGCLRRTP